jgi:seryl-tRNA synthetase
MLPSKYSFKQDFFFVCPSHLKDKGFCSPIIDEAAAAAKKKKEMEAEIERVKKEFEEKQKKKKDKEKAKEKENDKDKDKKSEEKEDKESDEKVKFSLLIHPDVELMLVQKKSDEAGVATPEEEPRVFALKKAFYQQRIDKKRNAEIAKRNRQKTSLESKLVEL